MEPNPVRRSSEAVLLTPVFLTLPVTVAVLKSEEPADCWTVPLIVIVCVPPELIALTVHFTCGAATTQPSVFASWPPTTVCDATMLAASRPCVLSVTTTSFAVALFPPAVLMTWIL
jgi:hypothetical protein